MSGPSLPDAATSFTYSPEVRGILVEALRAGPRDVDNDAAVSAVDGLEGSARVYLGWHATAKQLPDRDRIEQRARAHVDMLNQVKNGIIRARGVPAAIDQKSSLQELIDQLQGKEITPRVFEATVAFRFLSSGLVKMEALPVWLVDDAHRHRRTFFEEIALCWMTSHNIEIRSLQIAENSSGVGGRFLHFVQEASNPVLELTGETIGPRMTCNIVREIKFDPSPWLSLRLGIIDEYPPRK